MGGSMIISGIIIALMTFILGLVTFLIGLIGWVILKLMKDELNLHIKIGPGKEE
jgi:hypothetical protein